MKIIHLVLAVSYAFRQFHRQIRSDSSDSPHLSDQLSITLGSKVTNEPRRFLHRGYAYEHYQRWNHLMESFNIPGRRLKLT